MSWGDRDKRVLWHPFTQAHEWQAGVPLVISGAEGNYLIDTEGHRYLDGVSSLWVNVHGHGHPDIVQAIATQAASLDHSTLLGLTHPTAIELAEKLTTLAPAGLTRVFYSDSGSTAVEIALKQAFQYWALIGRPEKQRFVHLAESYHGDTLGAVGVGGMALFHRIFGALVVAGIQVPSPALEPARALGDLERLFATRSHEIAAIVIEPLVQGAAGMLVHPRGYLCAVAELCRRHDVLLIADEVATGFGRTGTLFACEQESVAPDFLCLAKGLTGGVLPLAATLTTDRVHDAFVAPRAEQRTFFHGHTYTGNPIACAAALASLAIFERERTLVRVRELANLLGGHLAEINRQPAVAAIRQCGLMAGIEMAQPDGTPFPPDRFAGTVACDRVRAHGVILRPLGDVIVWMPPLSATAADLDLLASATAAGIQEATHDLLRDRH